MNKFEEVLKYCDSAIEKSPSKSSYYNIKGKLNLYNFKAITLYKLKRFEESLDCFDSAI